MDGNSSSGVPVRHRRSGHRQSSKSPAKTRRSSQVTPQPEASRRGPLPEELCPSPGLQQQNWRPQWQQWARRTPLSGHLREALKTAKAQCQVRPVEDRIASTNDFFERARKRIVACQVEVSQAQESLVKAQSKLHQEEQGLSDGEARLATLMQESADGLRMEEVPPTIPADFANKPNRALVSPSCGERKWSCVRSCCPTEVAKNENANSQEVWQVPLSIWHL